MLKGRTLRAKQLRVLLIIIQLFDAFFYVDLNKVRKVVSGIQEFEGMSFVAK
jgi:hypothetical protein